MTGLGVSLRVGACSKQGGREYMEDVFVIGCQENERGTDLEFAFFAVYDGHGGSEASSFAGKHLMENIVNLTYFWSEDDDLVLKAIRDGFIVTHLAMWKELDTWRKTKSGLPSTAGTTASIVFVKKGKLYIGHVGDSRIVLGQTVEGTELWEGCSLTTDHKPNSPEERKRIYECGGLVMNKSGIDRVVWKRPKEGHQGPIRRSTDFEEIPFLAVSRSLGDLWSYDYLHEEYVVSPEPDVSVVAVNQETAKCIIIASDGLWNVLKCNDAVYIVQKSDSENDALVLEQGVSDPEDPQIINPAKALVDRAVERYSLLEARADNTSVITILIGQPRNELHRQQDFVYCMLLGCNRRKRKIISNHKHPRKLREDKDSLPVLETDQSKAEPMRTRANSMPKTFPENENCNESISHAQIQKSSAGPLQSINIFSNYCESSSRHGMGRTDNSNVENSQFQIPRWSKSASGQTSLSKLARWSNVVNWRRLSHPTSHKLFCFQSANFSNGFLSLPHSRLKHRLNIITTDNNIWEESSPEGFSLLLSNCKEQNCNCCTYSNKVLCTETPKHLSALKQAIKRKYPGSELTCYHSCSSLEHRCECDMPYKRKPVTNRMSITDFKAINEFRMSLFHRLKF